MDKKVIALMAKLEKNIIIPKRLSRNLTTKNEGITIYLMYRSSLKPTAGGFSISNVALTIRLDAFTTRDDKYNGDKINSKNILYSGLKPPIFIEGPCECIKVLEVLNNWIKDNDTQMFSAIGL